MHTISPPTSVPESFHRKGQNSSDTERSQVYPHQTSSQLFLQKIRQQHHVNSPLKVVALGDSLIYGFGDPIGGGWVEQLRRQWMHPHNPGHVLYNLGIRGNGVQQVSQRLDAEFHCRGELRHRVPDVILLSVGINDSARLGRPTGRLFTPMPDYEHHLDHLLDHAQSLCPVLFVGMVPVDEACMPFMDCMYYNHADQWTYKEVTKAACQARHIPYLDIFDLWISRGESWWRSRLCADGLHPNPEGYRSLLQDVSEWPVFQVFA